MPRYLHEEDCHTETLPLGLQPVEFDYELSPNTGRQPETLSPWQCLRAKRDLARFAHERSGDGCA